ncbi:MAG TPA: PSD1 and planctomycete cytochrome C domain-containing protein [Planctomycetota bacterium]
MILLLLALQVDFDRDVKPILTASCVKCHGPEKPKGRFRLDAKLPAFKSGHLKPHDVNSRFLQVLTLEDPDERMPAKAPPLPAAQIDLLRRWVAEGAKWPEDGKTDEHWSLKPIRKPEGTIDSLIQARLGGLKLAPPAEPRALIRRLTFTLTGLPPTPDEVDAFLAKPDVPATVDRLLASPRYGERWARLWLDAAHYADSHGHDQDRPRPHAWPYRDYLIRAFNEDVPYARFVQEQVAGDVLFPDSARGLVATGFLAAGPWDESSQMHIMADTVDKKIAQNLDRDDMLATALVTFMSTTVACARCHDHKFDPVSQVEYYQLQACFSGVDRTDRPFDDDPAVNRKRQELLRRRTRLDLGFVDEHVEDIEAAQAVPWTIVAPASFRAEASALTPQADGSLLAGGERPEVDAYTCTLDVGTVTALRLEVLTDDGLSNKGPGRQDNGNLHLSEFRVLDKDGKPLKIAHASSDFDQAGWTIAHAIDGKMETAWGVYPEIGRAHEAWFELAKPATGPLTVVLEQRHGRKHLIARPRLSVTSAVAPVRRKPLPPEALIPPEKRTPEQRKSLAAFILRERISRELAALPAPRQVYAAASDFPVQNKFSPAKKPRPIHLLHRGDVTQPRQPIAPGGLAAIPVKFPAFDIDDEGSRRAALAAWISDPANVLTWRSIANRVWHHHFGRGICDTPSDFGRMGGDPSHPALLDLLAATLLESGGSLKALHRKILTSDAFLRSSAHDPEASKVDAGNALLWRGNRQRLDADQLRDAVLAVSGRLDLTAGGPSVMQFHYKDFDPGRTPIVDFAAFDVEKPEGRRRSVYRWVFRTLPDPFLDVFDAADASQLTGARNVSVTPLQAMALRNNPFMIKQSEHFAARVGQDVELAYRLALSRRPTTEETAAFRDYAAKHGMSTACRVLLNCNEFLFLD